MSFLRVVLRVPHSTFRDWSCRSRSCSFRWSIRRQRSGCHRVSAPLLAATASADSAATATSSCAEEVVAKGASGKAVMGVSTTVAPSASPTSLPSPVITRVIAGVEARVVTPSSRRLPQIGATGAAMMGWVLTTLAANGRLIRHARTLRCRRFASLSHHLRERPSPSPSRVQLDSCSNSGEKRPKARARPESITRNAADRLVICSPSNNSSKYFLA